MQSSTVSLYVQAPYDASLPHVSLRHYHWRREPYLNGTKGGESAANGLYAASGVRPRYTTCEAHVI